MNSSRGFDPPRKLYEFYTVYQRPRHYRVSIYTRSKRPSPGLYSPGIQNWSKLDMKLCKKCRKAIQPLCKLRRTVLVLSPAAQNLWAWSRISFWAWLLNDSSIWIRMWRNTIVYLLNCLDDVDALQPAAYRKRLNRSALFKSVCCTIKSSQMLVKIRREVLSASFSMFGIFSRSHASGRMSPIFGEVSTGTSM